MKSKKSSLDIRFHLFPLETKNPFPEWGIMALALHKELVGLQVVCTALLAGLAAKTTLFEGAWKLLQCGYALVFTLWRVGLR